ncbi:MAG: TRAM domain-containing protein [Phycisphaerae bacterium]|nr:TRAM domain-containing protein [Phycisphaerae bacterium]
MVLHIVRLFFVLMVLSITVPFAFQKSIYSAGPEFVTLYILAPALVALAAVLLDMFWRRKRLGELSGLFFGVLAGLVIAYMLTLVVDLVMVLFPGPPTADPPSELVAQATVQDIEAHEMATKAYMTYAARVRTVQLVKLLLGAAAVFVCVSFVLQTKDDFRFIIPYVEFAREAKGARPLLLDTSVIIDGRIADIADTQILESETIVPRFVLAELQAIADSEDKLKRNRGRRGLDVLSRLQKSSSLDIRILDAHTASVEAATNVDAKLIALAKHLNGRVITNDFNLNKVAQLRGVDVININDLANALKPVALPGETMTVKIIKPGEEPGQGVGYLDDGTMVVVEDGRDHIGRDVAIEVTSALQTSAGRMIFGKIDADKIFNPKPRRKGPTHREGERPRNTTPGK